MKGIIVIFLFLVLIPVGTVSFFENENIINESLVHLDTSEGIVLDISQVSFGGPLGTCIVRSNGICDEGYAKIVVGETEFPITRLSYFFIHVTYDIKCLSESDWGMARAVITGAGSRYVETNDTEYGTWEWGVAVSPGSSISFELYCKFLDNNCEKEERTVGVIKFPRREAEPPHIYLTPNNIDFGTVLPNEVSFNTINIVNDGEAPATINISLAGTDKEHFEIVHGNKKTTIYRGDSHAITLSFLPDKVRSYSAELMVDGESPCNDVSATLQGEGGIVCCFPAGTQITMADGSYKNIEDVQIGDELLSYDTISQCFSSWKVKILSFPLQPIYEINNGLIHVTPEHPFYMMKKDSVMGWGAINPHKSAARGLKTDVKTLEIGDKILNSDMEWIEITDIEKIFHQAQAYNILSYSGSKTYFANDILVYEEFPEWSTLIKFVLAKDHPLKYLFQLLLSGKIKIAPTFLDAFRDLFVKEKEVNENRLYDNCPDLVPLITIESEPCPLLNDVFYHIYNQGNIPARFEGQDILATMYFVNIFNKSDIHKIHHQAFRYDWDNPVVVIEPGEEYVYEHFRDTPPWYKITMVVDPDDIIDEGKGGEQNNITEKIVKKSRASSKDTLNCLLKPKNK